MAFEEGLVLGFNSARCFASDGKRVFTPTANTVVVTADNGESFQWEATDGLYEINNIAVSKDGVICIAEKRLSVSLQLFNTDLRKLHEIESVASVEIQQVDFSVDGSCLFALCNYPSSCVKVFRAGRKGVFTPQCTVTLPDVEHSSILSAPFSDSGCDFVVMTAHEARGYMYHGEKYVEFFSTGCEDEQITCGVALENGVIFGTDKGNVYIYQHRERRQDVLANLEKAITSLYAIGEGQVLVATADNQLLKIGGDQEGSQALCTLPAPALAIVVAENGKHDILLGTEAGIYKVSIATQNGILFEVRHRLPQLVKGHTIGDGSSVAVSIDGSFVHVADNRISQWRVNNSDTVVDSCSIGNCLLITMSNGEIVYVDATTGIEIDRKVLPSCNSPRCASSQDGAIVVFDEKRVHFFQASASELSSCGFMQIDTLETVSLVTVMRGLSKDGLFLGACANGEIFLLKARDSPCPMDSEFLPETILAGMWRLDFPVADIFPCYVEDDVMNVLVHSIDKETKLYALDRKRADKDGKVLRPLFLMRDHESGGSTFASFNETTVCSVGKDGKAVLRDISPYQRKLSTIPPSKEKRKPIFEVVAWHFRDGGISSVSVVGNLLVCMGRGCVVKFIPSTSSYGQLTWPEPQWLCRRSSNHLSATKDGNSSVMSTAEEKSRARNAITTSLNALRAEWEEVLANSEVVVPVETFLLPDQRVAFNTECEDAVVEMKNYEHYHLLENEHTQDLIKEKCCKTMEVIRTKVVSIQEKGFEVHNFHIKKSTREKQSLSRKAAFLRNLQRTASTGRTFSSLRGGGGDPLECSKSHPEGVAMSLYNPYDVYTSGRATIQSLILKGLILEIKDNYNARYVEMQKKKSRIVSLIEERTIRCVQIVKQLGECPGEMFSIYHDKEEDPNTLFTVTDEELDESIRALIPKQEEATVYSAVNEAALKLWMDGLEKDMELLQVNLPPPDFADEESEAFVPHDERSEEQLALFEEYEKKLSEATEAVNNRKEGLRNEFKNLQKENRRAADDLDEGLRELRKLRVLTAEKVDQTELELVILLQHKLKTFDAHKRHVHLQRLSEDDAKRMHSIEALLQLGHVEASTGECTVDALELTMSAYVAESRQSSPFNDAVHGDKLFRRLNRWKRRVDDGKGEMPPESAPEDVPEELWAPYREHCAEVLRLRKEVEQAEEAQQEKRQVIEHIKGERDHYARRVVESGENQQKLVSSFLIDLLNMGKLYRLHQGQVQDERVSMSSDFCTSSLRWVSDVDQYNQLILSSAGESSKIQEKIAKRHRTMKQLHYERERLLYCIGTLQLELKQLHTLRVTRLMQEWLNGDADVSEDKALAKIQEHLEFIDQKMEKKLREIALVSLKIRGQMAERATENAIIQREGEQLHSAVNDARCVKELVDIHADGSFQISRRARDIFVTSELEELARSQQEELFRLKKEVDRLRERAFPSFAVVAKRRQ